MKKMTKVLCLAVAGLAAIAMGCAKTTPEDLPSSGDLFTPADIAKTWTSNCEALTDTRLGTAYYKISLTLNSNGSFSSNTTLYKTSGSPCSAPDHMVYFSTNGTFSIGSSVSGGYLMTFTSDASADLMPLASGGTLTTLEDAFNTDCGGTSPFCTLVNSVCTNNGATSGSHHASKNMVCQNYKFPNNNTEIYNVVSYDGTNLMIGAPATGSPGVYTTGAVAGTASVTMH